MSGGYSAIPRRAVHDLALAKRPAALRLLCLICACANGPDKPRPGWTYASVPYLAAELGIARQSVYPLLRALIDWGYVERTKSPRGFQVIYSAEAPAARDRRQQPGHIPGWRPAPPDVKARIEAREPDPPRADFQAPDCQAEADSLSAPYLTLTIPVNHHLDSELVALAEPDPQARPPPHCALSTVSHLAFNSV